MRRRDISKGLFATVAGSAVVAQRAEAQTCTAPCYAQTPAEAAVPVTPTSTEYPPGDPRRFGANQNSSSSDVGAPLETAMSVATGSNRTHIEVFDDSSGSAYNFLTPANITYPSGLGTFPGFHMSGHGTWFTTPSLPVGDFAISVDNPGIAAGNWRVKVSFSDLIFVSNAANTAGLIESTGGLAPTVNNVLAWSTGTLASFTNVSGGHVTNCDVFGNSVNSSGAGIALAHQGNFEVIGCNVYAMEYGISVIGNNNVGTDGAPIIMGSVFNGNVYNQILLKGTYTPVLMGLGVEQTQTAGYANIQWTNNQEGVLVGAYIGPGGGYSLRMSYDSTVSSTINDHNVVGYITAQLPMTLDHLFCCQVGNITMEPVTNAANPDGSLAVWNITNSDYNHFSDFNLHVHDTANSYSIRIDSTSGAISVGGGRLELPIKLAGTTTDRTGQNYVRPTTQNGLIVTDDGTSGLLRSDECAEFFDYSKNRWIKSSDIAPSGAGSTNYQLPWTCTSGMIPAGAGNTMNFNVSTLFSTTSNVLQCVVAEFVVFGGLDGSCNTVVITGLADNTGIGLTILAKRNASPSLVVSVSGSVITMMNTSGAYSCPYVVVMTRLNGYGT